MGVSELIRTVAKGWARSAGRLTPEETRFFGRNGWVGPFDLCAADEAARLAGVCEAALQRFDRLEHEAAVDPAAGPAPWRKSLHTQVAALYDLSIDPSIVDRVCSILGPDVLAWGALPKVAAPGNRHRWHVDIEHTAWTGVSAFVGLAGMSMETSLTLVSGSHRVTSTPQDLGLDDDEAVAGHCRGAAQPGDLVTLLVREGQFFLFDGRLWHGSHNTSDRTRISIILQYCDPSARVRRPLAWSQPLAWADTPAPCVLAAGADRHRRNRLAGRPD